MSMSSKSSNVSPRAILCLAKCRIRKEAFPKGQYRLRVDWQTSSERRPGSTRNDVHLYCDWVSHNSDSLRCYQAFIAPYSVVYWSMRTISQICSSNCSMSLVVCWYSQPQNPLYWAVLILPVHNTDILATAVIYIRSLCKTRCCCG